MARDDAPPPTSPDEPDSTTRSAMLSSASSAFRELERIGKCRIIRQVGAGGMGVVYEARQEYPVRRKVALKVLKFGVDVKEAIARFEAERQALALMDHPNVAQVFDAGTTVQGLPYYVMDFVDGEPISRYCDRHALSLRERLEILIPVCNAIQHAHQKGIIHRDLKPSNILITVHDDKPVPKVIDFGIAKATETKLTDKTLLTQYGQFMGTPDYMSPEQAQGLPDVDTRTDVYALGVVLYELLTGALPFNPERLRKVGHTEMLRIIGDEEPPAPSARASALGSHGAAAARARRTTAARLPGQLRGDLDWITMKALEKDRTRRYASVAEMAADLQRHLRHEPVLAGPPGAAYRLGKFVRRHRTAVGIVAVVVVSLVAGFVESNRQRLRAENERARAEIALGESEAVTEFLVSVFNVSDPGEARGNTITAREILDNGALRIQRELSGQPLLRAKMMQAMGRVYTGLGLSRAESLHVAALEIRQRELGDEHPETLESLLNVATLRHFGGQSDETATFEKVLSVRERIFGADHLETARARAALGNILGGPEGRRHLEGALPILEAKLGPEHREVADCLNQIAISYGMSGELAEELPRLKRALEIRVKALGPDHHDVGRMQNNIGYTLTMLGRLDEARPYLDSAHVVLLKSLGSEHGAVANNLHSLGELLRRQGYYAAARDTLSRALRIVSRETGNWLQADILLSLAMTEWALGNLAEAESFFRMVLEIHNKYFFQDHADRALALENYAAFLREMGRSAEAVALESRAKTLRERLEQRSDVN